MRKVTCSMGVSLDGYVCAPDGSLEWAPPDEEVFRFATEEVRGLGVHLLGRRLYESMSYWETVDQASLSDLQREFAAEWASLPKLVFSTSLTSLEKGYRLADGGLAEEVQRWRDEPGPGNIGIGGPTLAAEAAALGLLDEYRLRVHPVLLGGGTPFFPAAERHVDLELVDSRTFASGVVHLRYRVRR
ncbi:MAG: deaminase [Frankiales bacterium]|nr:deaminase [Frankiales bacterium]